jgi:hypothetical protein
MALNKRQEDEVFFTFRQEIHKVKVSWLLCQSFVFICRDKTQSNHHCKDARADISDLKKILRAELRQCRSPDAVIPQDESALPSQPPERDQAWPVSGEEDERLWWRVPSGG